MESNYQTTELTSSLTKDGIQNTSDNNTPEMVRNNSGDTKMVIKLCSVIAAPICSILFLGIFLFIGMLHEGLSIKPFIPLLIAIALTLILLIFFKRRIEIIKDIPNKKIIFVMKNCYGCQWKKLVFNEKIHFFKTSHVTSTDDEGNQSIVDDFFVINDFKDLNIDLNVISQKPIEHFYYYRSLMGIKTDMNRLNQFVGSPPNYENPLIFNIEKYMNKNTKESSPFSEYYIGNRCVKILKFNEHIYSYYIYYPYQKPKGDLCRIDFIFSNNFDEIFIGEVNAKKTAYKKTYQYNTNTIKKFMAVMKNKQEADIIIVFKDDSRLNTCHIKNITEKSFDGLIYLLNEKLQMTNMNNNYAETNGITPN
jgi:hypothetical protein